VSGSWWWRVALAPVCGSFVLALIVLAPASFTLAAGTSGPEVHQRLSCIYSSDDDLDARYEIYWDPLPSDGDIRVTSASRGIIIGYGFDGFGHSVRESMPGLTEGTISNTITGTFTDPDLQERVQFTTTVSLVLAGDCVAHQPVNLLDGVGFEVRVSLSCSGDATQYGVRWTLQSDVSGKSVAVETATIGGVSRRIRSVVHSEPLSSSGTISSTIGGYLYVSSDPSDRTPFESTFVASLVEPCRAPSVPVGCIGAPSTPLAHKTGLVDPTSGTWHLYDCAEGEMQSFVFGNPGDFPFMGDWDGNGSETPGLYRQSDGYVYLRNSNTQGNANIRFRYGNPGDVPIAGDFDGDGFDTVSVYRPSNQTVYVSNRLGSSGDGIGTADTSYVFGIPGDQPFVGDFDGDGIETIGVYRASIGRVYIRNSHTQGNADSEFGFGNPGDRMMAGDWNGDGVFTPAVFRPSNITTYFSYPTSSGSGDFEFVAGQPAWAPVSGIPGTP
jgi:hypothetical protein